MPTPSPSSSSDARTQCSDAKQALTFGRVDGQRSTVLNGPQMGGNFGFTVTQEAVNTYGTLFYVFSSEPTDCYENYLIAQVTVLPAPSPSYQPQITHLAWSHTHTSGFPDLVIHVGDVLVFDIGNDGMPHNVCINYYVSNIVSNCDTAKYVLSLGDGMHATAPFTHAKTIKPASPVASTFVWAVTAEYGSNLGFFSSVGSDCTTGPALALIEILPAVDGQPARITLPWTAGPYPNCSDPITAVPCIDPDFGGLSLGAPVHVGQLIIFLVKANTDISIFWADEPPYTPAETCAMIASVEQSGPGDLAVSFLWNGTVAAQGADIPITVAVDPSLYGTTFSVFSTKGCPSDPYGGGMPETCDCTVGHMLLQVTVLPALPGREPIAWGYGWWRDAIPSGGLPPLTAYEGDNITLYVRPSAPAVEVGVFYVVQQNSDYEDGPSPSYSPAPMPSPSPATPGSVAAICALADNPVNGWKTQLLAGPITDSDYLYSVTAAYGTDFYFFSSYASDCTSGPLLIHVTNVMPMQEGRQPQVITMLWLLAHGPYPDLVLFQGDTIKFQSIGTHDVSVLYK